ncbi:MAG TPA: ankyrin repeat domain-containing protein [Bryobacteraceae bacterium]|jgi:ankyrin repeat protein|nr:ankyrin repeat domain-containing protein [Bryobacteraceae bacterium]
MPTDPEASRFNLEFVKAALEDLRPAEEMLARHPALAGSGLHSALVLGDFEQVKHALDESPESTAAKGGPREWEPLLYVCFSRFAGGGSNRAGYFSEVARLLLSRGADPNASYVDERWPDFPLSCLYGATGLNNNPALARVLLEAGARPDDGESLYHSTEHADLACVRLLLEYGASTRATNVLKHVLDYEQLEGLQLLLAAGANPNKVNQRGETALHWAISRGRSAKIVAALLDAGAGVNAKRNDRRTAYALAARSGQTETAKLLESRGASTELPEVDRLIGNCAADPAKSPGTKLPEECNRFLPEFASSHRTSAVRALLAAGVPTGTLGESGGTALHWACWKGYADIAKMLLDSGASLTIEDTVFHAPPAGWFSHGLKNSLERDGDYPQVARLLLDAGAAIAACDMPTGDAAVDAVFREYGLIE